MSEETIEISKAEYDELINKLKSFSDFQRLSSFFIWMGMLMVILHIFADIYFHTRG